MLDLLDVSGIQEREVEVMDSLCRTSFDAFAQRAFRILEPATSYEWNWHIGCIAEHLEAVYAGEIQRIIINLPPRSLKSYLVSSSFPAWVLGRKPSAKFINTGFGTVVVEQNATKCRKIMGDAWYEHLFPETEIDPAMDRMTHFTTRQGGQYYAATALSPITGLGCEYMQIDDPIKPIEALSEALRTSTNENVRATLLNRFDDRRIAKLMVIMQRSHEADTTGDLLKDGGYVHLKLPAEAPRKIVITLKNKTWEMDKGDLLFPARLSRDELAKIRSDMTDYHYVGQYMQEPAPIGGGEFKSTWPQYYDSGSIKPKKMNIVILCDAAGGDELNKKKKKTSDWTAMMVVGLAPDNNYYWLDGIRDRLNPTERIDALFDLHRKWNVLSGKPPKVGYEKYGLMSDTHYIKEKQNKDGYRFALIELGGAVPKDARIRRMIPDLQNGRWWFPASQLYTDSEGRTFDLVQEVVKSEMTAFPRARFDDMLDALSRVYEEDLQMVFPMPEKRQRDELVGAQEDDNDWRNF